MHEAYDTGRGLLGKKRGGGPFSYSGTEPRSGMIQVYWSSLQYIPRTNSLHSRGSTKHI